ncbi:protein FAM124A isoform X8 [Rhinatrema bivittatum]|uniref:protein FAM124A isoform X8 n=1 Tax=Rhinatrema bivittatum TaxID=194408 RepID=UPI00112A4F8F|nr:protein FAM124A isoform X8 [Rhinatrema bivittatum]
MTLWTRELKREVISFWILKCAAHWDPCFSRSDYSRMSSTSSEYHFDYNFEGELSVEDVQDPFLVSIHIITDPGESKVLQEAIDKLLAWIHPDLQLFRVSERRVSRKQKKACKSFASQPALAVVLFLQEEYGEEQILQLHETFQRSPWKFHHTERVHGRFLPYMPCHQDFFTLATGTPLWAIRQVHYGKEIVRFTIYCRYEHFSDMMKLYSLILKRAGWQKKIDFCVYPVYSNMDVDIQFSLKRLPEGQNATPMESAVLEFRIKDFGQLIPLLPNPCSPISAGRWQTEDHDGNRILLQTPKRLWRQKSNTVLQRSKGKAHLRSRYTVYAKRLPDIAGSRAMQQRTMAATLQSASSLRATDPRQTSLSCIAPVVMTSIFVVPSGI